MNNLLLISEHLPEVHRQLLSEMKACLRLGDKFHAVKGSIAFQEPKIWNGFPVIQLDFCICEEWKDNLSIIMWGGRKPDEDDFMAVCYPTEVHWDNLYEEALFTLIENGELCF